MTRRFFIALCLIAVAWTTVCFVPASARAQFGLEPTKGSQLGQESVQLWRMGIVVTAVGGPCRGIMATAPVPIDWPEQQVKIADEDFSPGVRDIEFRDVGDGARQMILRIPYLAPGEEARAVLTFEVARYAQVEPADTSIFVLPEKLDRQTRLYLAPSPGIESRHRQIMNLAKETAAEHERAWEKVEALYDHVQENIDYVNGPFKGAIAALKDGTGDCEELSSLFIAMCRSIGVPARTVWIPGHCYAEFYLEDKDGKGYWFPCQPAGSREFGSMPEYRPILQKGDNFSVPEKPREKQRYVAEFLTGAGGNPKVKFIRELVNEDPLAP